MEPTTHDQTAASQADNSAAVNGTAQRLAAELAAKHGAAAAPAGTLRAPAGKNKGGRRTAQEEAERYLAENGLRAVPVSAEGDSGSAPSGNAFCPDYVVPPDFAKECALTILGGIKEKRVKDTYLRTLALSRDEGIAKEMAQAACPPAGTIETMSVAVEELAKKYQVLGKWTPEAMFIVGGLLWFSSDLKLQRRLGELETQMKPKPVAE